MLSNSPVEEKLDPRVKRTRALIEQAFKEVLAEKGFQAGSVQDIAEKAGVNRTTFYLHFSDKYALLEYSINQSFYKELEKRTSNLNQFSLENLNSLISTVAEYILFANSHCTPPDPQFEVMVEKQVKKQVQDILQGWGESNEQNTDIQTAAIASSWAIYGLALEWSHDKKRSSAETFTDSISPLILSILGLAQPISMV